MFRLILEKGSIQAGPQLGGKRRQRPPKQKFLPFKLPSMPTQTSLPLAAVLRWGFFGEPTENSEKSRPSWRDDPFFWISTENLVKLDQPKIFAPPPPEINLAPAEQRSSCDTAFK